MSLAYHNLQTVRLKSTDQRHSATKSEIELGVGGGGGGGGVGCVDVMRELCGCEGEGRYGMSVTGC